MAQADKAHPMDLLIRKTDEPVQIQYVKIDH